MGEDPTATLRQIVSSEERTGSDVTVTEYEWSDITGDQTGETREVNNRMVYEIEDFEFIDADAVLGTLPTLVRFRTDHAADGTTTTTKMVTSYGLVYSGQFLETLYEEFLVSGENASETVPAMHRVTEYDSVGRAIDVKEYTGETLSLRYMEFKFEEDVQRTIYTRIDYRADGVGVEQRLCRRQTTSYGDYELSAGFGTSDEVVIEKTQTTKLDERENDYTITRYDAEGKNPVETKVENSFRTITITLPS
jgi:hypothetical protein